jgi:hypothetical protein
MDHWGPENGSKRILESHKDSVTFYETWNYFRTNKYLKLSILTSGVPRGFEGVQHPSPKFRNFDKAEPNSQFRGKYIRYNLIRIRVSLICKLNKPAV